jgi:hypothetical protein
MKQHVLESAKAYTALVVGIATALLGVYGPDTQVGQVLTVVVAVGGAIAVWTVPNVTTSSQRILGKALYRNEAPTAERPGGMRGTR